MFLLGLYGERVARPGIRIDWQHARLKRGGSNLAHARVCTHELGKAGTDVKGVGPRCGPVDGAFVVVRDRESRSHGEGRQFQWFTRHIT